MHGARIIQVRGGFDHCLELAQALAKDYPVALVNSVNPVRLEGQKTAAFEIIDCLGGAPDVHVLPVGNAGNIAAYWKGFREYADRRTCDRTPAHLGLPGRGRGPAGARHGRGAPRDGRHRDPDRQPGLVAAGRGGPRRVRRRRSRRSPTSRSCRPSGTWRSATASSSSRPRPPASRVCSRGARPARSTPARRSPSPSPVTGSKDIDTPLDYLGVPTDVVIDADVDQAAAAAGPRRWLSAAGRSPSSRRRRPAPTSARASTRSGSRSTCATSSRRTSSTSGLEIEVTGEGADRCPRDESHLVVQAMRAAFDRLGVTQPGLRLVCHNAIPHGRGLGSSSAAIVAGIRLADALAERGLSTRSPLLPSRLDTGPS